MQTRQVEKEGGNYSDAQMLDVARGGGVDAVLDGIRQNTAVQRQTFDRKHIIKITESLSICSKH